MAPKEIERIYVKDAHGSKLQVIKYQEFIVSDSLNGRTVQPGLAYYEDMNRNKLNRRADGSFVVVRTGEVLTPW